MTTQKFKIGDLVSTNDNEHPGILYAVTEAHDTHVVIESVSRSYRRVVHFYDDRERTLQLASTAQVNAVVKDFEEAIEQVEDKLDSLRSSLALVNSLR